MLNQDFICSKFRATCKMATRFEHSTFYESVYRTDSCPQTGSRYKTALLQMFYKELS